MTKAIAKTEKEIKKALNGLSDKEIELVLEKIKFNTDPDAPPRYDLNKDGKYQYPDKTGDETFNNVLFQAKLANSYGQDNPYLTLELNNQLYRVAVNSGTEPDSINAAIALIDQIKPQDGIEAMLANQMVSIHLLTMETAKRASLKNQPFDGQALYLREVNKLTRTFAAQMDALNKHRGKGQQKMTVEHVHVNQGGQAIIGEVNADKPPPNKTPKRKPGGIKNNAG